jgi:hypothetical protein
MKWILLNLTVILMLIGFRQYAYGYHDVDTEDAYQGLVSRGLLDDAKVAEYAKSHNGWQAKERLRAIGNPDGFFQDVFVLGIGTCFVNSAAILFITRRRPFPAA